MPTWHPAALLRDETKKIEFWRDLKEVMRKYKEISLQKEYERYVILICIKFFLYNHLVNVN